MPIEPMSPGEIPASPTLHPVGRRRALAVGAAGLGALATPFAPAPDAHAEGEERGGHHFPRFVYRGVITEDLDYDPTGEVIFPSVVHAGRYVRHPLGEWHLYYAPHDDPGGICLMYADSLDGPWTEYENNPMIENEWGDHYSAPHVSSPHVVWNSRERRLFCYFHGPNTVTRFATSHDGVHWEYGGEAVTAEMLGADYKETSYARVFAHPDRRGPYAYGMFFMASRKVEDVRRIRSARSIDGRRWEVLPEPLVVPGELDGGNVSGGNLWQWRGQNYVIYHSSTGIAFARTVDRTLQRAGEPRVLHEASGIGEDVGRVAAPVIITHRGRSYLFYEKGARLEGRIACAVARR
ncbi:hypothetical protein Bra3105_11170 [Brachybacterium halotolerans subsp. kimchii]|uniref:hypothetical protein n=1 Tax=Brachybacterium halotolerans TaxID=2795215 RepID=UPI001E37B867|nr:hypothetical protein [Brachybacterium halotolerans]UEJ81403.1 hypothetical protein Bra3105_11170 [Brachybacterium halotolerans subsp. kimchii]